MKITGVKNIYVMADEGPDSPATTTLELISDDTVVLDSSMVNYINMYWDDKFCQYVVDIDIMGERDSMIQRSKR